MNSFFDHYWEIVSSPAHMAAEITFMLAIDVVVLGLFWPLMKRFVDKRLRTVHNDLDREHGVYHDPATGAVTKSAQ